MPFADPEQKRAYDRDYQSKHLAEHRLSSRRYFEKNRERLLQRSAEYRHNNLESCRKRVVDWAKNNPGKKCAKEAKRRAYLIQRVPKWADLEQIKMFYLGCPQGYHVDHVVPLKGKTVSGLHVLENLQYLPAIENVRKHNLYEEI